MASDHEARLPQALAMLPELPQRCWLEAELAASADPCRYQPRIRAGQRGVASGKVVSTAAGTSRSGCGRA
jgi:hypothetical protein